MWKVIIETEVDALRVDRGELIRTNLELRVIRDGPRAPERNGDANALPWILPLRKLDADEVGILQHGGLPRSIRNAVRRA